MEKFKDCAEGFTLAEAIQEAQRCLNCKVPSCMKGCPISNEIPSWIAELAHGNFGNAMSIISKRSSLPAVCSRVCAHERQCEGHCVLGKKDVPINIGRLERFISDFDTEAAISHESIPAKDRGRVAIIGSGPAGLTTAGTLARLGYNVEIFEMESEAGGVLMYGIPEYRLPKEVVRNEIKKIESLGVNIHLNLMAGRDFTLDELFEHGFDAVFMATGIGKPKRPAIPGINHTGVRQAIRFLRRVSLYERGYMSRQEVIIGDDDRVFIIGCGNTAMDAARSALRMGSREVTVIYHKTADEMSALRAEYNDAVAEGVKFMWNSSVVDIIGGEGTRLTSITVETEGRRVTLPADFVMLAVGSQPAARIVSTTTGIDIDDRGYVLTREFPYGMTTRRGVFAGGDVTNRPASVVHAMRDAMQVAQGIDDYVKALKLMESIENAN